MIITTYGVVELKNLFERFYVLTYLYLSFTFGRIYYSKRNSTHMEPEGLFDVQQIFLIHHNTGTLISHTGKEGAMDQEILGAMLSAVEDFIKDSFRGAEDSKEELKRLQYGDLKIHAEHGNYIFMAVVIEGKGTEHLHDRMRDEVTDIESTYGDILKDRDGNTEPFQDIPESLRDVFF